MRSVAMTHQILKSLKHEVVLTWIEVSVGRQGEVIDGSACVCVRVRVCVLVVVVVGVVVGVGGHRAVMSQHTCR